MSTLKELADDYRDARRRGGEAEVVAWNKLRAAIDAMPDEAPCSRCGGTRVTMIQRGPVVSSPGPCPDCSAKWTADRDTYTDREHRRRAVMKWVEKREADDLWIVTAPDGSTALVGGEAHARLIADAVNSLNKDGAAEDLAPLGPMIVKLHHERDAAETAARELWAALDRLRNRYLSDGGEPLLPPLPDVKAALAKHAAYGAKP